MKDMEGDVQTLKKALKMHVGATWSAVTKRAQGTPWTAAQNQRGKAPWTEVETCMTQPGSNAVGRYIAETVRKLTNTFYSFDP